MTPFPETEFWNDGDLAVYRYNLTREIYLITNPRLEERQLWDQVTRDYVNGRCWVADFRKVSSAGGVVRYSRHVTQGRRLDNYIRFDEYYFSLFTDQLRQLEVDIRERIARG